MRLLLVRHGRTHSNVHHLLDTAAPGADLDEVGREQAAALPGRLAGEDIGAINVSTLVRTQQTAEPLAQALGLTPTVRDEGREVSAGTMEMSGEHDDVHTFVTTVFRWVTEDMDAVLAGGETGTQVLTRFDAQVADACVRAADAGKGAAVVVAHGAVIRFWTAARAEDADASFIAYHPLSNTGIVVVEGEPGGAWRMESFDGVTAQQMKDGVPDSEAADLARDEREQHFGG